MGNRKLAAIALAAAGWAGGAWGRPFGDLRPVAVSGQTQTSAGLLGEISSQTINNNGQVAFRAFYSDPALPLGAFGAFVTGADGVPQLVGGEGRPAPGTDALFGGASQPPLNQRGEVAFLTTLQGGDVEKFGRNATALYVGTPQAQHLLAREGAQVPDAPAGVVYARSSSGGPFGSPLLNHSGQVAYAARLGGAVDLISSAAALFIGGPGDVRILSRAGDASPVAGFNFAGAYSGSSGSPALGPVLNDNGQVLFRDTLREAATGNLTGNEGLFLGSSRDNITVLLKSGDAAPDAPAGTRVAAPATSLAINNRGQVAFGSALVTPEGQDAAALYRGTLGNLRAVFRSGDVAPGTTAGVMFTDLYHGESVVMNAEGTVAFQAYLEGGDAVGSFFNRALYTGTPDDLDLVARLGQRAPDTEEGVVFRNIYGVALNARGQLAFHAQLGVAGGDASGGYGIFGYDPEEGLGLIARTGDTFELGGGRTATIRAFAFNAESGGQDGRLIGLNDLGQVAFTMGFVEGGGGGAVGEEQRGLFVASIGGAVLPEPGAVLSAVAVGLTLVRRRRASCPVVWRCRITAN